MSQISKQQLETVNQTNFPNNSTGYISAELLRQFNTDVIDSTVNQTSYTNDSQSFDSRLDAQEAFSSSLAVNFVTTPILNAATQSLSQSLTTTINTKLPTSTFNSYTTSTDGRLTTIENNYASVNAVNTFGQDQIIVGSLRVQESLVVDYSASFGTDVSMSGLDNYGDSRLGANASSINTLIGRTYLPGTLWINNISWSFYSSSIYTANEFIGNNPNLSFQAFSQSVDLRLDNLESFSSSLAATYATDAELAAVSAAIMVNYNTFSASQYNGDSSSFNNRISTDSSSFNTFSSSYVLESASFYNRIETNSSSFYSFSSSQYLADSQSFDSRLDVEEFKSTTFATTASNSFVGNQTITGSVIISSSAAQDLVVSGNITVGGFAGPTIHLSASNAPNVLNLGSTLLNLYSGSNGSAAAAYSTNLSRFQLSLASGSVNNNFNAISLTAGAPGTFATGSGGVSPITEPSIMIGSGSTFGIWQQVVKFQSGLNYTDGRVTFTTPMVISSSVFTSGSVSGQVGGVPVVSNTASIDLSKGNFFTLNIPTSSITYITATNIKEGQTVAVKLTQNSTLTGSVVFDNSKFKFWSGSASYNTGSAITGSTDIFTFVTFDTSSLWTTIVKNLV